MFTRSCSSCGETISYKSVYTRDYAERDGRVCRKCQKNKAPQPAIWERKCSKCGESIFHASKKNRDRFEQLGKLCKKCGSEKMAQTKQGKQPAHFKEWYERGTQVKPEELQLPCPRCGIIREFNERWGVTRAKETKSLCNSCATIVYKKSWNHVIKDEHRKKMAAKKAGYETFDAYMADLDNRKKYYRKVRALTRKQPLHLLPNYDKLLQVENRLNGNEGAYQVDHIISVSVGYEQHIPPEQIAALSNLQIIPWKDNLLKSNAA